MLRDVHVHLLHDGYTTDCSCSVERHATVPLLTLDSCSQQLVAQASLLVRSERARSALGLSARPIAPPVVSHARIAAPERSGASRGARRQHAPNLALLLVRRSVIAPSTAIRSKLVANDRRDTSLPKLANCEPEHGLTRIGAHHLAVPLGRSVHRQRRRRAPRDHAEAILSAGRIRSVLLCSRSRSCTRFSSSSDRSSSLRTRAIACLRTRLLCAPCRLRRLVSRGVNRSPPLCSRPLHSTQRSDLARATTAARASPLATSRMRRRCIISIISSSLASSSRQAAAATELVTARTRCSSRSRSDSSPAAAAAASASSP